jgi:hypothetical protein
MRNGPRVRESSTNEADCLAELVDDLTVRQRHFMPQIGGSRPDDM